MKIIYKIFLFTMTIISFTILFSVFSNKFFLNDYYLKSKEKELILVADNLDSKYIVSKEIERMNINDEISYTFLSRRYIEDPRNKTIKTFIRNNYEFELSESRWGPEMLKLIINKSPKGEYVLVTPLEKMQKAANISNKFSFYVGFLSLIVSIPFVFIFSKFLSHPITLINANIKEIIKLNFQKKLFLKSKDEFGETAKNLNQLSLSLENNLQELKNMNIRLQDDIDFERKKEKETRYFISAVTHELKTPITVINTHAEYIAEGYAESKEDVEEFADEIVKEGKHMTMLIDRLLVLLKNSSVLDYIEPETFEISSYIDSLLSKYMIDLDQKKVLLRTDLHKSSVICNKVLFNQVFDNLMSNAVSFVPADGNGIIEVNSFPKGNFITVEVINNGPNIPEKLINKIWDPFFKEDASRSRKYGGTGLGLSIVKTILEKIECKFGVVNLDKGVKFWFDVKKS